VACFASTLSVRLAAAAVCLANHGQFPGFWVSFFFLHFANKKGGGRVILQPQQAPAFDRSAPNLATTQPYDSLLLPWSPSLDAFHFIPDHCYHGMLSNDRMLSESRSDWFNLQTSTQQFDGHGVSDSNAARWYTASQINTVASQTSHDERSVLSEPTDRVSFNAIRVVSLILERDILIQ